MNHSRHDPLIRPGLCSVTFRDLTPEQIVPLANAAGLECIEWGADVHVTTGDTAAAVRVRNLTEDAGLAVASYGTYLTFADAGEPVQAAIETAVHLGAPRMRVWAGRAGSAQITAAERTVVTNRLNQAAEKAAERGIELGLEFHGGTLTDDVDSTLQLLDEVGHPNLRSYWQPHIGMPPAEALNTLERVIQHVSTIHVFSWWPQYERHPLDERAELWQTAIQRLRDHGQPTDALLEFVPDDDPAVLEREARLLRGFLSGE